jgi:hypothetical protein
MGQHDPIVPTQHDIDVWRLCAEAVILNGGVRPGGFNWPMVVLSLIAALEKKNERS